MTMKKNPRFYQVRAIESRDVMASFVTLVYDLDTGTGGLGCEFYCIFSNFDDSALQPSVHMDDQDPMQMRLTGQLQTTLTEDTNQEQQIVDTVRRAFGEQVRVATRKIRP